MIGDVDTSTPVDVMKPVAVAMRMRAIAFIGPGLRLNDLLIESHLVIA